MEFHRIAGSLRYAMTGAPAQVMTVPDRLQHKPEQKTRIITLGPVVDELTHRRFALAVRCSQTVL